MINLFWTIPQRFFHNAITWLELNFVFKDIDYELFSRWLFFECDNIIFVPPPPPQQKKKNSFSCCIAISGFSYKRPMYLLKNPLLGKVFQKFLLCRMFAWDMDLIWQP